MIADLEKIEKESKEFFFAEGYYLMASKDYEISGLTEYKGVKIIYEKFLPKKTIIHSNIARK